MIAIYSRKSRFTGKGESIENQIQLCKNYIEVQYGEGASENCLVYEDEGFSGGTIKRPDFQRMMTDAKAGRFEILVVYRLDRISRNIGDFAKLIEELENLGVSFISIREQFDTKSPMGRAMMYIASVFSQLERETIAQRIRDNMLELAKTGRWLGGQTPLGFSSTSVITKTWDGKPRKVSQLTVKPEEELLVKKIYFLYLQLQSLTAVEARLIQEGIRTRRGAYFSRFTIKSILENPVYLRADQMAWKYFQTKGCQICSEETAFDGKHGIMAYNRTLQQKGKSTTLRPLEEWIIAVGQHPGLISSRLWCQVQDILSKNQCRSYHCSRKNQALLTGILTCSCGSKMYPKLSRSSFTYVCKQKERSKKALCKTPNLSGRVDLQLLSILKSCHSDTMHLLHILQQERTLYDNQDNQKNTVSQQKLEKQLRWKKEGLIDSLSHLKDPSVVASVEKRIRELEKEEEKLRKGREREETKNQKEKIDEEVEKLLEKLSTFSKSVEAMPIESKRQLVGEMIESAIWDGETLLIKLKSSQNSHSFFP